MRGIADKNNKPCGAGALARVKAITIVEGITESQTRLRRNRRAFPQFHDLVELAVGLVMALVFAAVVKSLVSALITPIIALLFGRPNFSQLSFTLNSSHFLYGDFINSLITFLTTGFAVFFFVVKPYNAFKARTRLTADPDSDVRPCSECLSDIPLQATRCAHCGQQIAPASITRAAS